MPFFGGFWPIFPIFGHKKGHFSQKNEKRKKSKITFVKLSKTITHTKIGLYNYYRSPDNVTFMLKNFNGPHPSFLMKIGENGYFPYIFGKLAFSKGKNVCFLIETAKIKLLKQKWALYGILNSF